MLGSTQAQSDIRPTMADRYEDITTFVLRIIKDLEIPEDERREKEEFCNELAELVRRFRPSM
jgi:hypothetical protein